MKLGDVLPHWLFREKAGISAEMGSVFAHLTEDVGHSALIFNWPLIAGDPAHPLLKVDPTDGSIFWGNGAAPLDIRAGYDPELRSLMIDDGSATPNTHIQLQPGQAFMQLWGDLSDPTRGVEIDGYSGMFTSYVHGGGVRLTSPDGLVTKRIQISNAGTVVAV